MFFISLLLGLTPFVYSVSFANSFEFPKVLLIRVLAILLALYFALGRKRRESFSWDYLDTLSVAWIGVIVVSSLLAGNFLWSFWGGEFRYQGIFTQISLLAIFVFVRRLKIDFRPLMVAGVLQVILVALQFWNIKVLGTDILNYAGRPVGTFGQPGFVSEFFVACLGISFGGYLLNRKQKDMVLSILFALGSVLTLSLSAVLGIVSVVLAGLFVTSKKLVRLWVVTLGVVAMVVILFVGLNKERITVNAIGTPRVESRLSIWPASFKLFIKRPILGYGAENLNKVFPDTKGGTSIDRAHNALLDHLLMGGVFLGFLYITIVVSAIKQGVTERVNLLYLLAFLGVLVVSQVSVPGVVNLLVFWVLAGRLLRLKHQEI